MGATIRYRDEDGAHCTCKECGRFFTVRKDGYWQNHFLCSVECCMVRREQKEEYERSRNGES